MLSRLRLEPAVVTGVVVSVALLFGYELDPDSVLQVASVVAPFLAGLVTRFFVTPTAKVDAAG